MRQVYTLLLLLISVFFNQIAQAQTIQTVQFTPPVLRAPLHLKPGENLIRVGNLTPGRTYSFIPVAAFPEVKAQFKTTFANKKIEAVAQPLTPADRPQWRRMQVESTDVLLVVDMESSMAETPVSLSINCEDCPRSTLWLDKFKDAVESVNIQTTPGVSATSLITNTLLIGGDCFEVSGITGTGNANSRGTFNNGSTSIGFPTGAVLCTGHVNIIPGPNNAQNANNGFGFNSPDDPDLATLTNGNQFDLSRIVFDFTATSDLLQFDYVFASEEYCEFANTSYNDVFGFFISGPGISGSRNIALIPNSNIPITINNVNHVDNTQYYVNNNTWDPCQNAGAYSPNFNQFDGFTTVLTAVAEVIPCETYQIKLAIADVADQAYASAVFLKAISFNAGGTIKSVPVYPAGQNFVHEGCNNGFIRFTRSGDLSQPFIVNYTISGSATPGDDYTPLPASVTIPANQSFVEIQVSVLADLLAEGMETITITLENSCSCELREVTFNIQDVDPLKVEMEDIYICGNSPFTFGPTVEGGILPYTYLWGGGQTTSTITVNTLGITEYIVTVTDNCGTTGTAKVETNTVNDNDKPTVTCPSAATTINTDAGATCSITIPDYVSDLNPTDNCTASGDLNEGQDIAAGAYGVSGDGAVVTVTYTVSDDASPANSTSCEVVITVRDTHAPEFVSLPASTVTVPCPEAIPAIAVVMAMDNCQGTVDVDFSEVEVPGTCPNQYSLVRTWRAVDGAGNFTMFTQTIAINDTQAAVFAEALPASSMNLSCGEAVPAAAVLTATDNCGAPMEVKFSETYVIIRTWSAEDDCGNAVIYTQTITVNDNVAPTVSCPGNVTINMDDVIQDRSAVSSCSITIPDYVASLNPTDNCTASGDLNEYQDIPAGSYSVSGDGDVVTVTYTVSDNASLANTTSCKIVITVNDNDAPTVIGTLNNTSVEGCNVLHVPAAVTTVAELEALDGNLNVSDNCSADEGMTVTHSDSYSGTCPMIVTRTYSVTDAGGNTLTVVHIINVDDTTSPLITGELMDSAVTLCSLADTLDPISSVAGLESLGVSFSDGCTAGSNFLVNSTSRVTGSQPTFTQVRTYSVTDACGNSTTVTHTTIITVTCFTISGTLLHSKALPELVGVGLGRVFMTGSETAIDTTASDGYYRFGINTSGINPHTVTIRPRKLINKLNGVTSADVARIQQHIIGSVPLTNPYDLIAADVNRSKSVSSVDAVLISQALRGNPSALVLFDSSWRFVAGSHVFPNPPYYPTPPPASPFWNFTLHRGYTNLDRDTSGQDFIGVKVGDVASPSSTPNRPDSENILTLLTNDRVLHGGEEVTVAFRAVHFRDLAALQFVLRFDPTLLDFRGFSVPEASPLNEENFGFFSIAEGEIRVVWSVSEGLNLPDGELVFNLRFAALEDHIRLNQVLQLDDEVLPSEAYHTDLSPLQIELQFLERGRATDVSQRDASGRSDPDAQAILLLQNQPNPFHDHTTIGFVLDEPMRARLRVFDVTGHLLFEHAAQYPAGYQVVEFRPNQRTVPGLLVYELTTKYGTQTRKMNVN